MGQNIPEEANASDDLKLFKDAVDELEGSPKKEEDMDEKEKKDTETQLEEIKAHQGVLAREGTDDSPMHYLRRKELELKGGLLKAEKEAEKTVAEARRQATQIRAEADDSAVAEAKEYYAKEIEKAKEEAEKRRSSVGDEKKQISAAGEKNIEKAAKMVLRAVTLTD